MTTFYSIEAANARIPEVRDLLLRLRDQRDELVRLRDRLLELRVEHAADEAVISTVPDDLPDALPGITDRPVAPAAPASPAEEALEEGRRIRLRIQGVVDQMQASVARIDGWGITLRDIDSGLIDFPALVTGRQVWLCWRLGEDDVDWWHDLNSGVAGRKRLSELG